MNTIASKTISGNWLSSLENSGYARDGQCRCVNGVVGCSRYRFRKERRNKDRKQGLPINKDTFTDPSGENARYSSH